MHHFIEKMQETREAFDASGIHVDNIGFEKQIEREDSLELGRAINGNNRVRKIIEHVSPVGANAKPNEKAFGFGHISEGDGVE